MVSKNAEQVKQSKAKQRRKQKASSQAEASNRDSEKAGEAVITQMWGKRNMALRKTMQKRYANAFDSPSTRPMQCTVMRRSGGKEIWGFVAPDSMKSA
jgi:hypothetical protein